MSNKVVKKILIVSESIDVEDSSGTKGRVALIKNLHKIGYDLRVYHYTRKEINMPGISCIAIKENRWSFLFFLSRIERYTRYFFKLSLNKPLEKVFGFSFTLFNDRNSIITALRKIDNFNPDLILTLSKGGSFRPHHALLKMPELHKKWVAYIHDPYPMHLYPRPYAWVEPGYYQKWKFMKQISQQAAFSAFPSKLLMEWMGSYFTDYLERGVVIPHQIDLDKFGETGSLDYFNPSKFNILHAGNLLWGRNPEGLIQGYKRFLNLNPEAAEDCTLLFIGPQNHYTSILQGYQNKISQFYVSEGSISFNEVQAIQKLSAVNVILEAKSEISPFLPGKFPHCVFAKKPILLLGPYYSESKRLLGEKYPYWAEIDEEEEIAKILQRLYWQWKKDPLHFFMIREDLEEYLSIKYLSKKFNHILEVR